MCRESVGGAPSASSAPGAPGAPGASRQRRLIRLTATLAAAMLGLAACTGHSSRPPSSSTAGPADPRSDPSAPVSSSEPPLAASRPHAPAAATTVIDQPTPEKTSIAVSQALFASSAVVVISSPDNASIAAGAKDAESLGVPLLVSASSAPPVSSAPPASPAPPASSGLSASPSPPSGDGSTDIDSEVARLGSSHALIVGTAPAPRGSTVARDASELPAIAKPVALSDTTVLVRSDGDPAASAAAATARAAGAAVVGVAGDDPRGDSAAIAALSKAPKGHVVAVGAGFGPASRLATRVAVARAGAQLPDGGQLIFPGRRFVALYGHPSGPALGVLGAQGVDASIDRARKMAASYQALSDVPVVPTFEIIATVAAAAAGRDGNYSNESSVADLLPWVDAARAAGLYVVLDLQPGRADPLAQAKLYASLLELPNVGLAVDPEWALKPNQLPLHQIGSLDSSQINAIGEWLDAFTAAHHLPQKLFVVHQFRLSMIGNEAGLKTDYDNLALLIHMDGQGTPANKDATWRAVVAAAPKGVPFGWKNFYKEDHPMLSPDDTMARKPTPMMISYQ